MSADLPSFRDSMAELDAILADLERDDVDIDRLATQVARAAELIAGCQERLRGVRLEVEQIVSSLTADDHQPRLLDPDA